MMTMQEGPKVKRKWVRNRIPKTRRSKSSIPSILVSNIAAHALGLPPATTFSDFKLDPSVVVAAANETTLLIKESMK